MRMIWPRTKIRMGIKQGGDGVIAFVDEQVLDKCWNLYDSYGEICVHCGCCSKDKAKRYKARIEAIKGWIWEHENWYKPDDTWLDCQMENRRETFRHWRRMLRYYEKKLDEMGVRA